MFGFFKRGIQKSVQKMVSPLGDKVMALFSHPFDEKVFEELEKTLFEADLGSYLSLEFVKKLRQFAKKNPKSSPETLKEELKKNALEILTRPAKVSIKKPQNPPKVIILVGVNGSGKTTSVAKLAHFYQKRKKRVLLAVADTFRAAATEQLVTWATRLKIDYVKGAFKSDPASVIHDALFAAKSREIDIVIADTAGRLQSRTDLMQELSKIHRVCTKVIPESPHETLLILDTTTGQNSLNQTEMFNQFIPLTGLIFTKLDGSAKGGALFSIFHKWGIPIRYIGTGEKVEDLLVFEPKTFVEAFFS